MVTRSVIAIVLLQGEALKFYTSNNGFLIELLKIRMFDECSIGSVQQQLKGLPFVDGE